MEKPPTRSLLFSLLEKLSRRRKYLGASISYTTSLKVVITFHKEHPKKPTVIFPLINWTSPMARPRIKPRVEVSNIKQKQNISAKNSGINKRTKRSWTFDFYLVFGLVLEGNKVLPQLRARQFDFLLAIWHFSYKNFDFYLPSVFPSRYWPGSFFYQIFWFFSISPAKRLGVFHW